MAESRHVDSTCFFSLKDSNIIPIIKAILYELQPVTPAYALAQLKSLLIIIRDLTKGFTPIFGSIVYSITTTLIKTKPVVWALIIAWVGVLQLFNYVGFGSLFVILSMFAAIFMNLAEKKKGEMSAYSVFNRGFKSLLGTTTGQDMDRQMRHTNQFDFGDDDGDDYFDDENDAPQRVAGAGAEAEINRPRRRGKKARRGYEARLERRAAQQLAEDQFNDDVQGFQ